MSSNSLSILIADDEELARERIKRLLSKHSQFELCAEAQNGAEAVELAQTMHPDLVMLDIRMPVMDGLEAAQRIALMEPAPAILFCTAYEEYALRAFQLNAVAYLLKPAREEELLSSLKRAQSLNQAQLRQLETLMEDQQTGKDFIANTWNGQERIAERDIYYFKADHKYLNVVHKEGESLSNQTLKELENEYEGRFLRVHRNTLVNTLHIKALLRSTRGTHQLQLSNGDTVDISRRHLNSVKEFMSNT